MPINPRQIILKLLLAYAGKPLTAREAINGAAILGLRENSVRVALVRLAAEGLVEAAGRGSYRLGPKAVVFAAEIAAWRTLEERVTEWDGSWIAVYTAALGRSDRVELRARGRAFGVLGLRELERGLSLRPNNLLGGVEALRERLHVLGLDTSASVFRVTDFDLEREQKVRALWDGKALDHHYREARQQLDNWLARADELELEVAARESFLLGDTAIRSLVFDPLLPSPLVDVRARRAFLGSVLRFDRAGHRIWRRMNAAPGAAASGERAARIH
jgi:phenylacetic acid degradation operon negative regulatory protein